MKENQKKAFDFAADTTKQLITIATAIITLTVTFSKDILGGAENAPKTLLIWTWAIFICSIIFGVMTMMSLTGTLQPLKKNVTPMTPTLPTPQTSQPNVSPIADNECDEININNSNIRFLSILQVLFFLTAIIMTGVFGYKSLNSKNMNTEHKNTYTLIRQSILNNDTTTKYIDTLYISK
ncbi:MAG: hypothetical protein WCP85_22975 [Mariniphaga sp.]